MKKFLMTVSVFCFLVIACVGMAYAERLLMWDDPNPDSVGVYEYQAEFVNANGQLVANPVVPKGTWVTIDIPDGKYTVTVKAHNDWDQSIPSDPFDFTKSAPKKVVNIRLGEK